MKEEGENPKRYDLEDRTYLFAKRIRGFVKTLARNTGNIEDVKQLVRPIEANESLSRKDFLMRIKICRKEAKECRLFLRLIDVGTEPMGVDECAALVQEATELTSIFGAILRKSE